MTKIFIDPGHGGTDPGAVGNGLQEKNLTLQISKRIRDLLAVYENVQVKLSRETDQTLSLNQRTNMANAWCADFLLSVHINAGGGTGYEDYIYPGTGGATAAHQNAIHSEIMKMIDLCDRGKKQANFHMLRESNMPALLTECGFIDNANDAAKLKQTTYIEKNALGHANGIVKAFGLKKKEGVSNMGELTPEQEKVRQEAMRLGITDGKNPFREVNQYYVWNAMVPLARRVEELEKKVK
ncbi:N-acetylmuramoyl-L-alanine amidase [Bacillus sp. FJAT-49705]|uniref:N-acetylmuramoyl-L-alanine amidase n=1 Tax=Cytobacillus citreus TaxID=2833586 RepID=A0ABS5NV68_9BACI|nr:N-acetylmuramoyl-L-alanine amidase [Cytobacillus citreus]MBS4191731.1 N-acetylmuramoyl-L-alanine amidase [Cytobacillus citreus]